MAVEVNYDSAESLGLDDAALQRAFALLEQYTDGDQPAMPGAALLVGRRAGAVRPRFFGRYGPGAEARPLDEGAVFLLASITKPFVYLTALQLVEEGRFSLSDPVVEHLPEFAAHHKEATLAVHLFTHTSGLPDQLPDNLKLRAAHAPLSRFVEGAVRDTVPLFPPGTSVSYQSMGTLIVAEIVQRLTGQAIADVVRDRILAPVGMASSALGVAGISPERLVQLELPSEQVGTNYHWNTDYWRSLGAPWGGLHSTPEDLAKACTALLAGGTLGDVRLLSPAGLAAATTNRLHDLPDIPESLRRTQPWGLGWRPNHPFSAESWCDFLSPAAYGHSGATGTFLWIDPQADFYLILLTTAPLDKNRRLLQRVCHAAAAAVL